MKLIPEFLQALVLFSAFSGLLSAPREAGAQTCGAARIWTSPSIVHYRTVIRDSEEHRLEANFTVFIELPDGSAGDIDPASIALNGLSALDERSVLGDENQNGIPDLMIKSNRSVLVTGDGLLKVTGSRRNGACLDGQTNVQLLCLPAAVERSDDFIDFTTSNMPDDIGPDGRPIASRLNGRPAQLDVHRVKPVFPAGCPNLSPIRALVLVHGRTIPATADFDLQYQDYSLMERLAMRGIDAFAANHLGFGFSEIRNDNPLDNECNASLPQCGLIGGTCTPIPGVCDCQGQPAQRMDQQGSTRYLNPNPLIARCPHTINTRFERVTNQVEELDLVVDDALAKTGLAQVHLLGYSNGGHTVGKYLGDGVSHRAKVAGVIFLDSSGFGGIAGLAEQPSTSWPLGLIDRTDVMENFTLDPTTCPGQLDPNLPDALWAAVKARDVIGPSWGPQLPGEITDGLSRYPIVSRFLWNSTVASNIDTPALVLHGLKDNVVLPARGREIWSSSPLQIPETTCTSDAECRPDYACRSFPAPARCRLNNRILEQLDCASHALLWETCSTQNCVDPHKRVPKRVGDWILTGK